MSFPIEEKYIKELELELNVKFPEKFKSRMKLVNGGEVQFDEYDIQLHPFWDKATKKRLSRTCNHIGLQTKHMRKWRGFPENGITVGSDGGGNELVLIHNKKGIIGEQIFFWDHETTVLSKVASDINKLDMISIEMAKEQFNNE